LRRAFRTGEEEVLELMYPAGEGERYFDVRLSPEFGPDGSVHSVLGVGRDTTASSQRDAERAELYRELLARDARLHKLVERVLLSQGESNKRRVSHEPDMEQFSNPFVSTFGEADRAPKLVSRRAPGEARDGSDSYLGRPAC
jgi:hypothetical protein